MLDTPVSCTELLLLLLLCVVYACMMYARKLLLNGVRDG